MKKVCQISSHHSPTSIRIFKKQCLSLAKAGYEVHYIVGGKGNHINHGVIMDYFDKSSGLLGRLILNPFKVLIKSIKFKSEIYHFHDPELLIVGLILKITGKKVIYDVHENYHKKIYDLLNLRVPLISYPLSRMFKAIEVLISVVFDHIVVVNEEIQSNFINSKSTIIKNYPILELFPTKEIENKPYEKEKIVVIYIGYLSKFRGILEIINAMNYLGDIATLKLAGPWQNEDFKNSCMNLDGWKYCNYEGILPIEDVYLLLSKCDLGLTILHPKGNYINSLPTKSLEYMSVGMPVVMSDFPLWRELFSDVAIFVNPEDTEQIASAIKYYYKNPDDRIKKGLKGYQIAREKYSWESESIKLLNVYDQLVK